MGTGPGRPWPGPGRHESGHARNGPVATVPDYARHGPKKRAMPGSSTMNHRSSPTRPIRAYRLSVIVATILTFVFLASASIHLFLRFISRSSENSPSSSSSFSSSMPPLIHYRCSSSTIADSLVLFDEEKAILIKSLPLFSLASRSSCFPSRRLTMLSASPPSTPTTSSASSPPAATLSTPPVSTPGFDPPLCRSSISLSALPLQLPGAAAAEDPPRSSNFRIEISSVNHQRTPMEEDAAGAATSLPALPSPPPPPQ